MSIFKGITIDRIEAGTDIQTALKKAHALGFATESPVTFKFNGIKCTMDGFNVTIKTSKKIFDAMCKNIDTFFFNVKRV
jgi:hypothetical protein